MSATVESYSKSIFSFKWKCQTIFLSDYISNIGVIQFVHLLTSIWCYFFILASLSGIQWYLIMVLICISLMANNVGHLFISLFVTCITYSVTCRFVSLPSVRSYRFSPVFFFLEVLYFTLKSMIQFELIFV